jgi:hypothetical protein
MLCDTSRAITMSMPSISRVCSTSPHCGLAAAKTMSSAASISKIVRGQNADTGHDAACGPANASLARRRHRTMRNSAYVIASTISPSAK